MMRVSNDLDNGSTFSSDGPVNLWAGDGNAITVGPEFGQPRQRITHDTNGFHVFRVSQSQAMTIGSTGIVNLRRTYFTDSAGTNLKQSLALDAANDRLAMTTGAGGLSINVDGTPRFSLLANGVNLINMGTTTASANVSAVSGTNVLQKFTSLSRFKLNQEEVGVEYGILDMVPKTWHDKWQYEQSDGATKVRHAGFIAEEVQALSIANGGRFDSLIAWDDWSDTDNLTLQGVNYERVAAFLIPVMRDMARRITELETARNAA